MPSKLVTQREKTSTFVESSMDRYGARASLSLAEKLRPYTDDSTPEVDINALFQLLSRALGDAREELIAADEVRVIEQGDDIEPRRRRDAAASVVSQHVSDLRAVAERLFGTGASVELLRVDGRTSRDPVILHRQAQRILQRLADPDVEWPESRYEIQISLQGCAEELRPHVEALGIALDDLRRVQKRSEDNMLAKTEAMEAYDLTYLSVSRIAEAIFRFTGYGKVADRLRPSRRRSPQLRSAEEEPADGDGFTPPDEVEVAPEQESPPVSEPPPAPEHLEVPSPDRD